MLRNSKQSVEDKQKTICPREFYVLFVEMPTSIVLVSHQKVHGVTTLKPYNFACSEVGSVVMHIFIF